MGKIYSTARKVIIWLGYAFKTAAHLLLQFPELTHYRGSLDDFFLPSDHVETPVSGMATLGNKLGPILLDEYWTRMWIIQEILLAGSIVVRIACWTMSWQLLDIYWLQQFAWMDDVAMTGVMGLTAFQMSRASDKPDAPGWRIRAAGTILHYRRKLRSAERQPQRLYSLILAFSTFRCLDFHDHVFALNGLATLRFKIDYRMPISQLYVCTLVDGLLGHREDAAEARWEFWPSPFIAVLSMALGLNIETAVVYLLTKHVLLSTDPLSANFFLRTSHLCNNLLGGRGSRFAVVRWFTRSQLYRTAWQWMMECRLRWLKRRNSLMTMPGHAPDTRTYADWVTFAESQLLSDTTETSGHQSGSAHSLQGKLKAP